MGASNLELDVYFQSVEKEVKEKLESMIQLPYPIRNAFLDLAKEKLPASDFPQVEGTLNYIFTLKPENDHHPSMLAYISHPLRVAYSVLRLHPNPDVATINIALMHNIFEITSLSSDDVIAAGYSKKEVEGIRLLTIDRTFETDHQYLSNFYNNIENWGAELSLIRCADKLDNLLGSQIIEDDAERSSYIDLAKIFVAPMAYRLSPAFGEYFMNVITFAEKATFERGYKHKLDQFIAEHMG